MGEYDTAVYGSTLSKTAITVFKIQLNFVYVHSERVNSCMTPSQNRLSL